MWLSTTGPVLLLVSAKDTGGGYPVLLDKLKGRAVVESTGERWRGVEREEQREREFSGSKATITC